MKSIAAFVKIMLLSIPCALANFALLGWLERFARGGRRNYPSFFEAVIGPLDCKFWFVGLLCVLFAQGLWLVRMGILTGGFSIGKAVGGHDSSVHVPVPPLQAYAVSVLWSVIVMAAFLMTRSFLDR